MLNIPINDDNELYVIQETVSGHIREALTTDLTDHDPTRDPSASIPDLEIPTMPWVRHQAKATIFLPPSMKQPKQGYLSKSNDGEWSFIPGRTPNQPANRQGRRF